MGRSGWLPRPATRRPSGSGAAAAAAAARAARASAAAVSAIGHTHTHTHTHNTGPDQQRHIRPKAGAGSTHVESSVSFKGSSKQSVLWNASARKIHGQEQTLWVFCLVNICRRVHTPREAVTRTVNT